MSQRFQGKVALVTGIGRRCVLMFVKQGARVVGCDMAKMRVDVYVKHPTNMRFACPECRQAYAV